MHYQKVRAVREALFRPKMRENIKVHWIYGDSGTGKTNKIWDLAGLDAYILTPQGGTTLWWDGYQNEDIIILDNLTKDCIQWMTLMSILDKYPLRQQVKGGMIIAKWTSVFCSSIAHPRDLLPTNHMGIVTVQEMEICRRVTTLTRMTNTPEEAKMGIITTQLEDWTVTTETGQTGNSRMLNTTL